MAQQAQDLEGATVQALLGLTNILGLTRSQRYQARQQSRASFAALRRGQLAAGNRGGHWPGTGADQQTKLESSLQSSLLGI